MAGTVTLHTDQLTLTTPTVSLYPDGSDTAAETGTSATEATNRKGTYTFSNATATGLHLIILISSATQRWYGWAVLATSGNIVAYDTRAEAIRMQATASTGVQDVNATQLGGDAQSLTDLKDFADAGYDPATNKVEGVKLVDMTTTNSDMRGTDNALTTLGSNAPAGWINEAAFANDAITDAKVASDVTIASVTGAVGSVTGNVGGNVTGTIGGLSAQAKADVNTEADTALSDVGLTSTVTGRIDAAISTRLASASYTAPLDAAGVRTAVGLASANLDTQIADLPTVAEFEARTLVAANYFDPATDVVSANVTQWAGNTTEVTNFTTVFSTDFAANYNTTNDGWVTYPGGYYDQGQASAQAWPNNLATLVISAGGDLTSDITGNITGNLSGSVGSVTNAVTVGTNNDKTGYSLENLTVQASTILATGTHNPQTGDAYAYLGTNLGLLGANATEAGGTGDQFTGIASVGAVAGAVTVGTNNDKTGYSLATAPPTAAAIADAVWDEAVSGHSTAGTFGKYVADIFGLVAKFSGITSVASWLGAIAGKTADTATRAEINATTAGAGYNETTDSLEAAADASVAQTGDAYSYLTTNLGLLGANATEAGGTGDQFTGIASVGAVAGTVGGVAGTTQTLDALATLIRGADGDTLKTLSDQIDSIPTTIRVKKNAALTGFPIVMIDTSGDPATGKTVTGTVSLDGAAFASLTNPVSEVSGGLYKVDLASADTNGNTIVMRFSATGCRTRFVEIVTQP